MSRTSQLYTKLAASGHQMPLLGFGTFQMKDPEQIKQAIRTAIKTGYRHIDTAFAYENEHLIGRVLKQEILDKRIVKRDDLFVTTKLFSSFHRRHRVLDALADQLKSLRLNYVDLYLIHFPVPFFYNAGDAKAKLVNIDANGKIVTDPHCRLEDTWRGMEDCVKKGLARSIGLSNCNIGQVQRVQQAASVKPDVNQVELHPVFQNKLLADFCLKQNVKVTAYSPFASPGNQNAVQILENPVLLDLARKHHKTPAQVILRWLVQNNVAVVAKSATPGRIVDNFQIWDFDLDDGDMVRIAQLDENRRVMGSVVAGVDEHPEYPFK